MISDESDNRAFREGEEVVLDRGTYQCTPGVFLRPRKGVKWADIPERDGSLWCHPGGMANPLPERGPDGREVTRIAAQMLRECNSNGG